MSELPYDPGTGDGQEASAGLFDLVRRYPSQAILSVSDAFAYTRYGIVSDLQGRAFAYYPMVGTLHRITVIKPDNTLVTKEIYGNGRSIGIALSKCGSFLYSLNVNYPTTTRYVQKYLINEDQELIEQWDPAVGKFGSVCTTLWNGRILLGSDDSLWYSDSAGKIHRIDLNTEQHDEVMVMPEFEFCLDLNNDAYCFNRGSTLTAVRKAHYDGTLQIASSLTHQEARVYDCQILINGKLGLVKSLVPPNDGYVFYIKEWSGTFVYGHGFTNAVYGLSQDPNGQVFVYGLDGIFRYDYTSWYQDEVGDCSYFRHMDIAGFNMSPFGVLKYNEGALKWII